MKPFPWHLARIAACLLLAGCGVRDTEVDSIPGPGARSTRAEGPESSTPAGTSKTTAGINSVGRPADAAGGHPGPPSLADKPRETEKGTRTDPQPTPAAGQPEAR